MGRSYETGNKCIAKQKEQGFNLESSGKTFRTGAFRNGKTR